MKLEMSWLMRQLGGMVIRQSDIVWGFDSSRPFRVSYHFCPPVSNERAPELELRYILKGDNGTQEEISYSVIFTATPCNYGGVRYWFICPLSREGRPCQRRVGVLYFGHKYFGCRHCMGIEYESQSVNYGSRVRLFALRFEAQEYEEKYLKRYTWGGRPTKQLRRLGKIYSRLGYPQYADLLLRHYARGKNITGSNPS